MLRLIVALVALLALQACGADRTFAPDDEVARARYVHSGPPEITLFTVINNRSGEGAHSALMINGSERVIFDPAGTWYHPWAPIRYDVHHGITPHVEDRYIDYHTRITYSTVVQRLQVTPEVAERTLRVAQSYGPVPRAFCGDSVSDILRQSGFESISRSFFPNRIMRDFAALQGVTSVTYTDDDPDDNSNVIAAQMREAAGAGTTVARANRARTQGGI